MLAAIAALGAEGLAMPCVAPAPLTRGPEHEVPLAALGAMQAIAFASRHAAHGLHDWLTPTERRVVASRPLYAVGPSTAQAVARAFGRRPLQAEPSDAHHLLALLLCALPTGSHQVLLPAAKGGRRVLYDGLRARGHNAHFVPVYETLLPPERASKQAMWPKPPAYILFGSPSAVTGFLRQAHWPVGARALSIGPATSQALAQSGIHVAEQSLQHDAEGLLATLALCLQQDAASR